MTWGRWRNHAIRFYILHVDVDACGLEVSGMAAIAVTGWNRSGRATAHLQRARAAAQRLAARLAPSALTVAGLGCIDIGVFEANTVAGWIATGISLLVLEYRIDDE